MVGALRVACRAGHRALCLGELVQAGGWVQVEVGGAGAPVFLQVPITSD